MITNAYHEFISSVPCKHIKSPSARQSGLLATSFFSGFATLGVHGWLDRAPLSQQYPGILNFATFWWRNLAILLFFNDSVSRNATLQGRHLAPSDSGVCVSVRFGTALILRVCFNHPFTSFLNYHFPKKSSKKLSLSLESSPKARALALTPESAGGTAIEAAPANRASTGSRSSRLRQGRRPFRLGSACDQDISTMSTYIYRMSSSTEFNAAAVSLLSMT